MGNHFKITKPAGPALPLIFNSGHSGHDYPADFRYACDLAELRRAEDVFVDDLFSSVTDLGATLLSAEFPRSYIDVNRAIDDIDAHLLYHDWPGEEAPINPTARSHAGIGLIRRLVRPGLAIYDRFLSVEEIKHRIAAYYAPYHEALQNLIDDAHYNYGSIWLIDCHSMPDASARPKNTPRLEGGDIKSVDFVLSDRDGATCRRDFMQMTRKFLQKRGYSVSLNDPYKGAEIISRHGIPMSGRYALQIEINKSLYSDEKTGEKNKNYVLLKSDLNDLSVFIADFVRSTLISQAAD